MNLHARWCMCVIFGFSKTVEDINCFEDLKACFIAINKFFHDARALFSIAYTSDNRKI